MAGLSATEFRTGYSTYSGIKHHRRYKVTLAISEDSAPFTITWRIYSDGDNPTDTVNTDVTLTTKNIYLSIGGNIVKNDAVGVGSAVYRYQEIASGTTTVNNSFNIYFQGGFYYSGDYSCIIPETPITIFKPCGRPDSLTALTGLSNELYEGRVLLSWPAGSDGMNNAISNYEIQQRIYSNSAWSAWSYSNANVNISKDSRTAYDSATQNDGEFQQFRIRCVGSIGGESYYSDWRESNTVKNNTPPTGPGVVSLSASDYSEGESVTLSWSSASDVDANITQYQIKYATSSDNVTWSNWTFLKSVASSATSGSTSITPTGVSNNGYIKYRVIAIDAFGQLGTSILSVTLQRKDDSCVYMGIGGVYKKCSLYIGINGVYKKMKIYAGAGGLYKETKS